MSLTVTLRPYQTINSEKSAWNAVANPVLYKMQRKDYTFASITNSGGFVRLVLTSTFGDVSANFTVGDVAYFTTDAGVYDTTGTVTASSYSAPNTLVTLDTAYISSSTGYVNNDDLRPLYRVEVSVYDQSDTLLNADPFSYTPSSKGLLSMDISAILRANMVADNDADLTGTDEVFEDTNAFTGFYIKYREVWTGSAESLTNDSAYEQFALLGAMQIPSEYGGNIYNYLLLSDMKIADVTLTAAQILTGNATPVDVVAAPGAGYIIIPVKFFLFLDYGSAAYATNTDFRFEINGVAVSATNTTMLPGVADRYTTMATVDYDTTTDLRNQAIKFEVQTGNPTNGGTGGTIRVVTLYTVKQIS
jgi:hypothetical protein